MKKKPAKNGATKALPKALVVREPQQPQMMVAAAPGTPEHMIQSIAQAAANPNVDVAKMKELYAMHSDMMAKKAEVEFNDSFARVQSRITIVVATHDNTQTKSKFAKLADIDRMLKPLYTAEGFALSFGTGAAVRENDIRVTAKLSHRGGHSVDYFFDLPRDEAGFKGSANKTGVQGAGSTIAYGRRYLTCMIFNVATDDDKDGNNGGTSRGLPDKAVADHSAAIESASDHESLRKSYVAAFNAADDVFDKSAKKIFMAARDKRKTELGIQ